MKGLSIWQNAFEWTYYDSVLNGLKQKIQEANDKTEKTFQAMFCMDDRERFN